MALAGAPSDWQLECENVEQSCGYLLTSGLWSDCAFVVGSETNQEVIEAHKLVLAMASPVFEAMLYGELSEDKVPIPDVEPQTFRALLQYIYTGDLTINSFDMACDLWLDADKYMLPHLVKKVKNHICSVVGPSNACRAYELARLFDDKAVMEKCIQIISTKTKEVLNDSSFEDVELNTLITVCSLDHLTVDSEVDLFQAVERYAEAGQGRAGQSSSPKVLQRVGNSSQRSPAEEESKRPAEVTKTEPTTDSSDSEYETENETEGESESDEENFIEEEPSIHTAIQKIRFLSLNAQEFAACPGRSDLLTDKEKFAILMNIAAADSPVPMPPGFSVCRERRKPRNDSQKQCLKPGSLDTLDNTVNELKCGSSSQVKQPQYFEPGSLDHTINALRCGSPSQVKDAVLATIKIMRDAPPYIQPALDKGILNALVPALTEGDDQCKNNAVRAITLLCALGSPSQLAALAASDALLPYCRLLVADGDTCIRVLCGLTDLLKRVEQNTKTDLLRKREHSASHSSSNWCTKDLIGSLQSIF